jgi:hypothetical protein
MSFLAKLADQISSQYSLGDNNNHSLDIIDPVTGKQQKYGSLGDFAQHFDQSAERRYVEEGYLRRDPYNTDPKQFEILMQEPSGTILLKKRMFTSVAENFRPDFMDRDEKFYFRAMRILFQNKSNQIAALEKLAKLEKISSAVGQLDAQLMPILFSITDTLTDAFANGSGIVPGTQLSIRGFGSNNPFLTMDFGKLVKVIDRMRKVYSFNSSNKLTTWITDPNGLYKTTLGTGTGTIEITNFTSLTTNTSTNMDGGFSFSIVDPYQAMLITEWDIEKAISDASNSFYKHKSYQFGQTSVEQIIDSNKARLNKMRAARKASAIDFYVSPDTLLGQRVTTVIARSGIELVFSYDSTGGTGFPGLGGSSPNSVTIADEYLKDGEVAGFDGLESGDELSAFKSVIVAIYSKIQLESNSRNAIIVNNKNTNYARRKLRFNFAGKQIIQPMDVVHIYLSSKSRFDNKLLSGLNNMFTGNGILQNLNKTFTDLKSSFNLAFHPSDINIQLEKSIYVGSDFPNYLWAIMRNQFVNEREGTHVIAGVIESARDSWHDGKFSVSVSGRDNTYYFDQGQINFKPGADNFNGAIYDPLTPFKTNFDTITNNSSDQLPKLLTENEYLLSPSGADTKGTIVKLKAGPYAGNAATSNNIVHDQSIDPITGNLTRTYYAPDGLVYKWKEGIGVFTQFGSSLSMNDKNKVGNTNTYIEPLAGQDIMNTLSLLITGQPYNFATYWKAAVELHGFSNDPQTLQNPAHSFITSLRQDLTKSNMLWGNFIPFKTLSINEQAYVQALNNTYQITTANKKIEENLKLLSDLNSQAETFGVLNILDPSVNIADTMADIKAQKDVLLKDVQNQIEDVINKSKNVNYVSYIGNDTSFDFNQFVDSSAASKQSADPEFRRNLRRQINQLTRRMSYDVRANSDKNLFIVDDFYDKDYDILAFDKAIAGGTALYNQEFTSTKQRIQQVAHLLNLEVFADTQGHIRVRPPQYNRMPSSVFYRMMYLKQTLGIQVFPEFLSDLFNGQLKTLRERVEILEDGIRLDCAVLGFNDDKSAIGFISGSGASSNTSDSAFLFLSDANTGSVSDVASLLKSANPDTQDSKRDQSFNALKQQVSSTKAVYTNGDRYNSLVKFLKDTSTVGGSLGATKSFESNSYVDDLISRIQTKSGQRIPRTYFEYNNGKSAPGAELPNYTKIDYFKVTSDLADKIKERQKVLKLLYSSLKNANEFKSLDEDNGKVANRLMAPGLFGNKNIPEVFEHMIEDEGYDDYGLGSGSRYIIKRSQIRDISIWENPPDYSMVEVHGYINDFASQSDNNVQGLDVPNFGNGMTSAVAIDYDMWRNYGLKHPAPITVPFLKDPVSQCAPFATMLLSMARKNIFRGTVTISGNEYMQPGEVVFIEDRGMLFYVTKVTHTFSYAATGGSFTTQLDLSYGHTPGEYIPTTLDIFGKLIYKNKDIASFTVQRQSGVTDDISMGVLVRPENPNKSGSAVGGQDSVPPTPLSEENSTVINNILFTVANVINGNNTRGNNYLAKLELRLYYDDIVGQPDPDLKNFANIVRGVFVGNNNPKQANNPPPLGDGYVQITFVNMSSENEFRSPSQKAIDYSRNQINSVSVSGGGASPPTNTSDGGNPITPTSGKDNSGSSGNVKVEHDKLRISLFKYIIDCWVTFTNVGITPTNTNSSTSGSSNAT